MKHTLCALAVLALAIGMTGHAKADYSYETIDVPGATRTIPFGINNAGDIVGWYRDAAGRFHGFLLRAGTFTTINVPGAVDSFASRINNAGQIVGNYNSADGRSHGYLLNGTTYTTLDVPGALNTFATGINDPLSAGEIGQIVGSWQTISSPQAARGFLIDLSVTPKYYPIDLPGSTSTAPAAINNDGQIVGTTRIRRLRGFLLSDGGYTVFRVPGAILTFASCLNDPPSPGSAVQIVGTYQDIVGRFHGFLRTDSGYLTIDFPDSTLTDATGINNNGLIVGDYQIGDETFHGFLATPN